MTRVNSTTKETNNNFNAANGTGAAVRAAINNIFDALRTINAASGDPSGAGNVVQYQPHIDSSTNLLKICTAVSSGTGTFTEIGNITQPNLGLMPKSGGTFTGSVIHNYTGALRLPVGTTAQRPGSPSVGDFRWNSTLGSAEIYDGSSFTGVGGGGTTINNNADNRVITGSGTANTLNGESSVVIDANGKLGIGTSSPTLSSSAYQGIHIHQTASGGAKGSQIHLTNDYGGSAAGDGSHISHYNNYLYINNQENGSTYFFNNGSPTATILANGNFGVGTQAPIKKLDVNGDIKANSIYLGGTGTANQLEDYEEGTFVPSINSGFTVTYGTQDGNYTKIGNLVYFRIYININSISGSSDNTDARINGLPFGSANESLGFGVTVPWIYGLGENVNNGYVQGNANYIELLNNPSGGDRDHTNANSCWDQNDLRISITGVYRTP